MTTDIHFTEFQGQKGNLGIITLNRPAALNALSLHMIHAMYAQLKTWVADNTIKAIILQAVEGRAFCAGGDIRQTYDKIRAKDPAAPVFFRDEYQLNRLIFHYPKPYISLLDGITMGGGVGISIHGSHRVATERLMFAMPETGIGFFPDVGGTYFLPRLPDKLGYLLGLTGSRINSDDCIALGIAQHKVAHADLPTLLNALAAQPFGANPREDVSAIINELKAPLIQSTLFEQRATIRECFAGDTMENILGALQNSQNEICKQAALDINKKSPTSLKVTLRALQAGAKLDFDTCMQQEYHLACHFLAGHDFAEGIRAVVVDKDQKPQWQPANLAGVTTEMITAYFKQSIHITGS